VRELYTIARPTLSAEDLQRIESVRKQHDAQFHSIVAAHFTLVFGCDSLSPGDYASHVQKIASQFSPIDFICRYVMLSNDDPNDTAYAFLVPDNGFAAISRLHDALYTGPLRSKLRLDLPYIPHITLGRFSDRSEAKSLCDTLNAEPLHVSGELLSLEMGVIENGKFSTLSTFPLAAR
jgi:2'-5' RNA ligase